MAPKEPKMKYKYIYAIDIHPPIVKHILQMYYEIYIHPPCAQRAPRQPPTDIYPLIVGSMYPIQNVKMYIPPPQYQSIHITHCSWEQPYLIFVIFCTPPHFLACKLRARKVRKFAKWKLIEGKLSLFGARFIIFCGKVVSFGARLSL